MTKEKVAFVNTEQSPIKIGPVMGLFVKEDGNYLVLYETKDYYYPHPDAPLDALIQVTRTEVIKRLKSNNKDYSALVLLKHAQNNILE